MSSAEPVSLAQAFKVWVRIAALSFGGPAGQISVMHRTLVEEHNWLDEKRFLHAMNYCMLLPGPEAQQLCTYIGWLMNGVKGGLIAGGLFILPGFVSILVLSAIYSEFGELSIVEGLFFGLQAAVLAIILQALINIAKRVLNNWLLISIAITAFVGIYFFNVSFPLIVLSAGIFGYFAGKFGWQHLLTSAGHGSADKAASTRAAPIIGDDLPAHAKVSRAWSVKIGGIFLALWLLPVFGLLMILGKDHIYSEVVIFFSKMAVVSFGGAYAVLAYVAQEGVSTYAWLTPAEMLDGLGMAETTPGPLIQVVQFVGYLGGYRDAGSISPLMSGLFAAVLTTWVTFIPCFLWIFVGAPYVETLRKNQQISATLTAVTAAVVGVILNLAVWFTTHALFDSTSPVSVFGLGVEFPDLSSVDIAQSVLCLLAIVMTFWFKVKTFPLLLICALTGMAIFVL